MTGLTVHAGSRIGLVRLRTSSVICLSVWLSSMTVLAGREAYRGPGADRTGGSASPAASATLTGQLHVGGGQHDQVVADPLEVGDEMGGEHHADLLGGHHLHQIPEELPSSERVQVRPPARRAAAARAAWR